MNQQQLDAIKKRVAAATPGPWRVGNQDGGWAQMCAVEAGGDIGGVVCDTVHATAIEEVANLDFIAHSWQDITDLLAEVERVLAACERASEILAEPTSGQVQREQRISAARYVINQAIARAKPQPGEPTTVYHSFACPECGRTGRVKCTPPE